MREGFRRTTRAVYIEPRENCLNYGKHNGNTQFHYKHITQRCGEAKSISK